MVDHTRRKFLRNLGLAGMSAATVPLLHAKIPRVLRKGTGADPPASRMRPARVEELRSQIHHIIIIFQENRSFDHYFGTYQRPDGGRVANLIDREGRIRNRFRGLQKNPAGIPYTLLPVPKDLPGFQDALLPNAPFHMAPYLPADVNGHWDPEHRFFRMAAEMNNGRMDRFVALGQGGHSHLTRTELRHADAETLAFDLARPSGPVLGFYDRVDLPFYHRLADHYTLFDHFFQAMTGGSTGNALYLVAARSCINPKASAEARSPSDPRATSPDHPFYDLPYDQVGTLINDLPPVQGPTGADNRRGLQLSPPPAEQHYDNIGDRLTQSGLSWAWYNENWNLVKRWALDNAFGPGDGSAVIDSGRLYEAHHNPFQYYPRWPDYVRGGHIRSSEDFIEDAQDGKLPAVSFLKATAAHTEHPADCAPAWGMGWVERLVHAVARGPHWKESAIFITYDEGGGFWDSMPPPVLDFYGLGTRIPALLVSPFAKTGFVDHEVAHSGSLLKLIETRFGLPPLNHRDQEAYDLLGAFDWDQPLREFMD